MTFHSGVVYPDAGRNLLLYQIAAGRWVSCLLPYMAVSDRASYVTPGELGYVVQNFPHSVTKALESIRPFKNISENSLSAPFNYITGCYQGGPGSIWSTPH